MNEETLPIRPMSIGEDGIITAPPQGAKVISPAFNFTDEEMDAISKMFVKTSKTRARRAARG